MPEDQADARGPGPRDFGGRTAGVGECRAGAERDARDARDARNAYAQAANGWVGFVVVVEGREGCRQVRIDNANTI